MPSAEEIVSHAQELLRRVSPEGRRQAQRRRERRRRQLLLVSRRMMAAAAIVLGAMIAWGLIVGPVGQTGLMIAMLALGLAWFAVLNWSRDGGGNGAEAPAPATDLAALPSRTEDWLDRQRAALPAPAQRPLDAIALQLEVLGAQLPGIDPREPAAIEVRRLVGDELPALVRNYRKVPPPLRRVDRDGGPSPDRQLVEGLGLIGEEIARMNRELAAQDLHALATQGRYLELKYRDGEIGGH